MTAPLDLDALERAAVAATPGPWHAPGLGEVHAPNHDEIVGVCFSQESDDGMCGTESDADFIAAANPAVITELVRRLRAAEALLDEIADDAEREIELGGQTTVDTERIRAHFASAQGGNHG